MWPPLDATSKEMFATNKKTHIAKDHVVLEYGLKDSPCSIEWIAVRYKCIRNFSMEP